MQEAERLEHGSNNLKIAYSLQWQKCRDILDRGYLVEMLPLKSSQCNLHVFFIRNQEFGPLLKVSKNYKILSLQSFL